MTKGKKRSREETEDPNPRPAKKQITEDNIEKLEREFVQINDDCVKKAILRINNRLFANLDVIDKIQQDVKERDKNSSNKTKTDNIFNNANAPSDAQSKDEESASEKSAADSKTKKKRGRQPKKDPSQVQIRYPKGKKLAYTPRVHKMPPMDNIPNSTTWAAVSKNYPVADNRERTFMPYYSDEEERDLSDLDTLYDQRFFLLEDHDSDNILEGYIQRLGTRDANQILPDDKMQYLAESMECETPENLKKYLVEKTNYVRLYCQNNSTKPFDLREFDTTLSQFFCRRCYLTYCPYHNNDADYFHYNMNEKNSILTDKVSKPCSDHCFVHGQTNASSSNSSKADVWTERDVIAFNKAKIKFTTSCQIHKVMRTKTCKQIFDRLVAKDMLNKTKDHDVYNFHYENSGLQAAKKKLTRINRSRKDNQKFDATYWPCSHPGMPCGAEGAYCPCAENNTYCEKFCSCSKDCERKFQGCNCSTVAKSSCIKGTNTNCLCVQEMRECDPDICKCKCDCYNALALLEKQKKVSVRKSNVAGWGLFADTKIKAGEFVAEYKGDLISLDESERRGRIYDERKVNFLFGLHNSGYVVDATRKGNKMKFANHSPNPNVDSCIESTLGELRIVMRAARDIEPDEELFINYGYSKDYFKRIGENEKTKSGRKKGMKKASLKETPKDNSDDKSTSEAQKKKRAIYRTEEKQQDEGSKKELPVIKVPPKAKVPARLFGASATVQANGNHVIASQSNGKNATTNQNGLQQQNSNPNPNKNQHSKVTSQINNVNINNTNQSTSTVQVSDRRHYHDNNGENRNTNAQEIVSHNNTNINNTNQKQPKSHSNSNHNQKNNDRRSSLEDSQEISYCDDSRSVTNADVSSVRSNQHSRSMDVSDDLVALRVKQRKVLAPKLHYKTGPPVVDLDSEAIVARKVEVPVCLSSGEEEPLGGNGVVDVEDQEVEYMGKFVDVHSIDSD